MGDELRGENLVHLNVGFSTETEFKRFQDLLYEKSGQGGRVYRAVGSNGK